MTREVEHVAYSLHTELVVVEYGLDFIDDILVDDPRCGLLGISVTAMNENRWDNRMPIPDFSISS